MLKPLKTFRTLSSHELVFVSKVLYKFSKASLVQRDAVILGSVVRQMNLALPLGSDFSDFLNSATYKMLYTF